MHGNRFLIIAHRKILRLIHVLYCSVIFKGIVKIKCYLKLSGKYILLQVQKQNQPFKIKYEEFKYFMVVVNHFKKWNILIDLVLECVTSIFWVLCNNYYIIKYGSQLFWINKQYTYFKKNFGWWLNKSWTFSLIVYLHSITLLCYLA